ADAIEEPSGRFIGLAARAARLGARRLAVRRVLPASLVPRLGARTVVPRRLLGSHLRSAFGPPRSLGTLRGRDPLARRCRLTPVRALRSARDAAWRCLRGGPFSHRAASTNSRPAGRIGPRRRLSRAGAGGLGADIGTTALDARFVSGLR